MHWKGLAAALVVAASVFVAPQVSLAASCDGFIVEESGIASDLKQLKRATCKRYEDRDHNEAIGFGAAGKLRPIWNPDGPQQDFAPRLMVFIMRYRDNPGRMPPLDVPEGATEKGVFSDLNRRIGARTIDGRAVDVAVLRFDEIEAKVTSACVAGGAMSDRDAPTRIVICRSVARSADDASVMEVAERIASEDFAAINP